MPGLVPCQNLSYFSLECVVSLKIRVEEKHLMAKAVAVCLGHVEMLHSTFNDYMFTSAQGSFSKMLNKWASFYESESFSSCRTLVDGEHY